MKHKAQSILDYAVLVAIVAASLGAMVGYVSTSITKRMGHIVRDLNDPQNGIR